MLIPNQPSSHSLRPTIFLQLSHQYTTALSQWLPLHHKTLLKGQRLDRQGGSMAYLTDSSLHSSPPSLLFLLRKIRTVFLWKDPRHAGPLMAPPYPQVASWLSTCKHLRLCLFQSNILLTCPEARFSNSSRMQSHLTNKLTCT